LDLGFPVDIPLKMLLTLYYQVNSLCTSSIDLSIMAATLANDGVNPISKKKVLEYNDNVLSLILDIGLNDYNKSWKEIVGCYPAISSSIGGMFVVVPGHFGLSIYSPTLNENFNTTKGIEFCKIIRDRLGDFVDLI